ncbi:MAG: sulfatase [Marinilabiliaceae bacterium]|jgi:arylsulfatase A-like enzyme|nr:sulfatase [Marinilabiliaceae bacterium]
MRVAILLFALLFAVLSCGDKKSTGHPNVVFICIDDLRAELGVYGKEYVVSPNLDKLANDGTLFLKHFVNVPTCGASRYTLLTGKLPSQRAQTGNEAIKEFISSEPERETPESFIHRLRRSGYYTVGIGKISHYADGLLYAYTDSVGSLRELPYSWDELHFDAGKWGTGWNAFFGYADGSNRQSEEKMVYPYERGDVDDNGYPDGLTRKLAIEKLRLLSRQEKPFFLGVGFFKPHLPFTAPAPYWDLYSENDIPLSTKPFIPGNINIASLEGVGEINQYLLGEEKSSVHLQMSDEYARKLRHAYLACVSYIDALVGNIIDELKALDLYDNTVIVVWGDHGWQLGDHLVWGKHTLFEDALRSTLIIRSPGQKPVVSGSVVSTIDIYPTILELCNIDNNVVTDGESLLPHIQNTVSAENRYAFSYFRNGISLRTDRYRLTEYFRGESVEYELYDLLNDPDEKDNVAGNNQYLLDSLLLILSRKGDTGLYRD